MRKFSPRTNTSNIRPVYKNSVSLEIIVTGTVNLITSSTALLVVSKCATSHSMILSGFCVSFFQLN